MKENKETTSEQTVNDAAEKFPDNEMPEVKTESAAAKPENAGKWGDSSVTKKFLALALAAAVLINAGVTAGVMALTARHNGHGGPDMHGSRPGSEMFSKDKPGNNGQMRPKQKGQKNSEQNTPQTDTQNSTQDQPGDEA